MNRQGLLHIVVLAVASSLAVAGVLEVAHWISPSSE
jgi:hypothetical protein